MNIDYEIHERLKEISAKLDKIVTALEKTAYPMITTSSQDVTITPARVIPLAGLTGGSANPTFKPATQIKKGKNK